MSKWQTTLTAAILAGLSAGAAGQDPAAPAFESIIEDKEEVLKDEMAAAEEGDLKEFTVVTDDDVRELDEGDIYKSNTSFFKVTKIHSQGRDGGEFVVQRIRGKLDPVRKWNRVSGLGPPTIVSRETLLDRFLSGGVLMYPIAFLLLAAIVIAINSLWVYRRAKQCPREFVSRIREAIDQGDLGRFKELAIQGKGLFANVCRAMVTNWQTSTVEDIKSRCESETTRQVSLLRTPLRGLNFIASVAPLLGLLGTVIGMIICFDSLAGEAASAGKSQAMAAGIKVALLTTAAGLSVAVPALFVFFIFNQKLNLLVAHCQGLVTEFVHGLAVVKRGGDDPPTGAAEGGAAAGEAGP